MAAPTHGMVHDDRRHVSRFSLSVDGCRGSSCWPRRRRRRCPAVDRGAASTTGREAIGRAVVVRRRWVAGGLREDMHLQNTRPAPQTWTSTAPASIAADFAHVFDVKAGRRGSPPARAGRLAVWRSPSRRRRARRRRSGGDRRPIEVDASTATLRVAPRRGPPRDGARRLPDDRARRRTEPRRSGASPASAVPADAVPLRRLDRWRSTGADGRVDRPAARRWWSTRRWLTSPRCASSTAAHPDRVVIAAGAPWFMTLFGRDSLLTPG